MKKKIFITIFSIIFVATFAFIVYAASVKIEYNYDLKVETPSFTISDGKIAVSISNQGEESYTIDTANSYVDILEKTENSYNVLTHQKISEVTSLDSSKTYIVFANTLKYTKDSEAFTVTYHNEYVSSITELKTINYSKYYNNIFDYSKNTNNLALRIIFISSFEIDEEITIKAPVSLSILYDLTLSKNLNITNSYAGNYDITLEDASLSSDNSSKIVVSSEKAKYKYDTTNSIIELKSSISLDSAKSFISSYIPPYLVSSIYLPERFLSSSITYDYYVVDQSTSTSTDIEFNGILEDVASYVKDNKLKVKVKVTSGETIEYIEKDIIYVNSIDSLKLVLERELSQSIKPNDFDFLYLIKSLGYTDSLTFKSSDGIDVIINNKIVESDTTITYDKTNSYYIDSSSKKITSIIFRRTSISSTTFTLNINDENITINLKGASKDEVVEYIKQYIHAYIVTSENLAYGVLNIKDNKVYLGTTDLNISSLDLFTDINYKIFKGTDEYKYYTSDTTENTITIDSTKEFTSLTLKYYDSDTYLFSVAIKRSLSSNSGEDTGFESNNPFDAIFNSQTNWLTDNTFTMPNNSTYSSYYAKINITKINGHAYDTTLLSDISVRGTTYSAHTHNMISITQSGNQASNNSDYYKTINFNIDYNYIPNFDSQIQVECLLYNNDAKEVTSTQIYTFTIPGILKCGTNNSSSNYTPCVFSSSDFYSDIITYFENNSYSDYYIDIDSSTSYILASAKNASEIVVNSDNSSEISVDGIEYFTNTSSITINNYKITDLSAFAYLIDSNLTTLNLDSNNITSTILGTNLYNLRLNSLSLKDNDFSNITSFKGLFFRTITKINLNSSKLTTIRGIDSLVNLNKLYIESNNIDEFESLKNLDYLTDVYLTNNTVTDDTNGYYGTSGLVSEVVYYWLIITYSTVIHMGEENTNNYTISTDTNHNTILLYLNAISVPTKMKEVEYNDLITNLETNNIMKVSYSNSRLIVSFTSSSETLYREFYIEVTS